MLATIRVALRKLHSSIRMGWTLLRFNRVHLLRLSRIRWEISSPDLGLTWGQEVDGAAFVAKMDAFGAFDPGKMLLEMGPGYGRLLTSLNARGQNFRGYVGVDLSKRNVAFLSEKFADPRITFHLGDMETFSSSTSFDVFFSSLTFKHLFPSFEKVLGRVARHLNPGALVFFDLIEGSERVFEASGTYVRHYEKTEVRSILKRCGLEMVALDEVYHAPGFSRLFVVAQKRSA